MTPTAATGTVRLRRTLAAPPARVCPASFDPDALVRWLPPYGFTAKMHAFDVGEGGGYRMSFTNSNTGSSQAFTVQFFELVENERIRHTDIFDDPDLPGEMQGTTLKQSIVGTDLQMVQEGIPAAIPVDMCYLGWRDSLEMPAKLLAPEICNGV